MTESLVHALRESVRLGPDRNFLEHAGASWTWGELEARVARVAGHLTGWGVRRGDRVALYLENGLPFVESYLAVLWIGGVAVPVNTRYRRGELTHILSHSGARLAVTDPAGEPHLDEAERASGRIGRVVIRSAVDALDTWAGLAAGSPGDPQPLGPDDLAMIGYTSGTTGRAKGARLTHGAFCENARAVTRSWGWTHEDRLLLALPLFHMHGLGVGLHGTLLAGSSLVLKTRFEASEVWDDLVAGRATLLFGVPTMHTRLVTEGRRRGGAPRGLRLVVSGSAPLSRESFGEIAEVLGRPPLERYGMTETVMLTGNPLEGPRKPGSVGLPFPGVSIRILDPRTLAPLPPGESGEVCVRGPSVLAGYWNDPAAAPEEPTPRTPGGAGGGEPPPNTLATAEAFTPDGWFRTGDLGFLDEDGYLVLNGRARELIISGGFNVYPREVEEALESHPAVSEAAVLGVPDPDLGELVAAAVVIAAPVTAAQLQGHCAGLLAGFKKPRIVAFLAELPRNALGKVQKHLLHETLRRLAGGGSA